MPGCPTDQMHCVRQSTLSMYPRSWAPACAAQPQLLSFVCVLGWRGEEGRQRDMQRVQMAPQSTAHLLLAESRLALGCSAISFLSKEDEFGGQHSTHRAVSTSHAGYLPGEGTLKGRLWALTTWEPPKAEALGFLRVAPCCLAAWQDALPGTMEWPHQSRQPPCPLAAGQ